MMVTEEKGLEEKQSEKEKFSNNRIHLLPRYKNGTECVPPAEVTRLDHQGFHAEWFFDWLVVINHKNNNVCLEYWQDIA